MLSASDSTVLDATSRCCSQMLCTELLYSVIDTSSHHDCCSQMLRQLLRMFRVQVSAELDVDSVSVRMLPGLVVPS